MTQKKPIAWLLTFMLMTAAVLGGAQAALAEEIVYTDRPYQSSLTAAGGSTALQPGSTVTLTLSVTAENAVAHPFGIRAYDNTITIDTNQFEVLSTAPDIGLIGNSIVNPEYEVNLPAHSQKIKWVYVSQNAAADQRSALPLGTIVLKVKDGAVAGEASIVQSVEGISDHKGAMVRPSNVTSDALRFTIEDERPAYYFGLEVDKRSLSPGETMTMSSYVTSSEANFTGTMASNRILFDRDRFELVSWKSQPGVLISTNGGISSGDQIVTLVYNGGDSIVGNRLELAELTLRAKVDAAVGNTAVKQDQTAVLEAVGSSQKVTAAQLQVSILGTDACHFKVTVADQKEAYWEGDTLLVTLSAEMGSRLSPRMLQSELIYSKEIFELVSTHAISDKGTFSGKNGMVKYVYFDEDTAAAQVDSMELGSMLLRVKPGIAAGTAVIGQQEGNLYDQNGWLYQTDLGSVSVRLQKMVENPEPLTGSLAITGTAVYGATLTADTNKIGPAGATYDLAWYREGMTVAIGTGNSYTVQAGDIGKRLTLKVTGTGSYTGTLEAVTAAVTKAAGPAAPKAPELAENGLGVTSITLAAAPGQEYRMGEAGQWQDNNGFTGLEKGQSYTFYTRAKETATHLAGEISQGASFTTLTEGLELDKAGTVSLGSAITGYTTAAGITAKITNSGTAQITGLKAALSGVSPTAFILTQPEAQSLTAGASTTLKVTPAAGLAKGTYLSTVTVTADKGLAAAFEVSFEVVEKGPEGVSVSGTVDRTVGKGMPGTSVVLTTNTIANAKDAYGYKPKAGDYTTETDADGNYRLEGVARGTYTMLIRKGGAGYYQKNQLEVGGLDLTVPGVTLYIGDLNGDGRINATDITVITNIKNYNKKITDEGVDISTDLNGDGRINATDITSITNKKNYNVRITVE